MHEKRKYEVVTPVEMDRRYEPGTTILLSDQDAGPLLAVKAVKEIEVADEHDEGDKRGKKKG